MSEVETKKRSLRKKRTGVVVNRSGDKSIVVLVERRKQHELYKKVIRQFKKYHVHDEKNEAKVGDRVEIVETRPISKLKRWRLVSIG
jgi:small subunit ribosomal protein S17